MTGVATALCAAISIDTTGEAPDWLHLLPAGEVRTHDRRGPYRVADAVALMSASMAAGKLPLDENHATDLAAPLGQPAPARGWIVELQQRADGVWGRVEWTPEAIRDGLWRAYRGVSPVIAHLKDKTITRVLRASLTNTPNFAGLVALHSQEKTDMDFRAWLIEALGLDADAADDAIVAAMKKRIDAPAAETALQSALAPIAQAAGLGADADAAAVLAGVRQLRTGQSDAVVALQSELNAMTTRVNDLVDGNARRDAEAFVDAAIAAGRVGVKAQRGEYVAMHMENRERAERLIGAIPAVQGGAMLGAQPGGKSTDGLSAADEQVVALMSLDRASYAAELAASRGETIA